jgi:hypothetical protein
LNVRVGGGRNKGGRGGQFVLEGLSVASRKTRLEIVETSVLGSIDNMAKENFRAAGIFRSATGKEQSGRTKATTEEMS